MTLDSPQQKANLLACIAQTAATMKVDASDSSFEQHAALVQLRREVEGAKIVPPTSALELMSDTANAG